MASAAARHHADEVFAVVTDSSSTARSAVAASWVRSAVKYGLDPEESRPPECVEQARLNEARERLGRILQVAGATLDKLFEVVGGAGCCVLLTDGEGIPVERRASAADDAMFYRSGFWTGMVWHEASEGTNGVGTALAEGRALTIHHDQHFFTRNTNLSCTVAPLFDHAGGIVGALDVSSCRRDLEPIMLPLIAAAVSDAARRIEAANFRSVFSDARVMLCPNGERDAAALIAVDRDDLVIGANRMARKLYNITPAQLDAGLPAATLLREDYAPSESLRTAERSAVQRALASARGNVSSAATQLGISRATLHRKMKKLGV